ncbi:hypothetical protein B0H19DRAFT_327556 [Mycena capillaripes]|nr:hypothetical protein B0H19DRAFT_327556 [Mycena capillaripes]
MSLTTTRSIIMHAALAHVSPELREFDLIAFGKLRRRTISRRPSLSSMPIEMSLLIRAHMLPVLITQFIAISATSLQVYEASLRRLICPQCRIFNEYVYGLDVWKWHLAGPCSCAPNASHIRRPNPKQFRDRHHWLETYLSRKSLRFRGLSPQSSSSSTVIWDIVADVLRDFGCEVIRMNSSRRGAGMALLSRWDRNSIVVVPLDSTHSSFGGKEYNNWTAPVLLRRLERDLGLSREYKEPRHRPANLSTTRNCPAFELAAASTRLSSSNAPVPVVLLQILDAITAPLTTILSILLSFVTLFFTVLCYYSRPGALRLF